MMLIDNKLELGQIAYLKTDTEQRGRIVIAIQANPNGLLYCVQLEETASWHYLIEISTEKNILNEISRGNNER